MYYVSLLFKGQRNQQNGPRSGGQHNNSRTAGQQSRNANAKYTGHRRLSTQNSVSSSFNLRRDVTRRQ